MSSSPPPSPPPNNWLATLVLALAAALGIPTAIIGISTHFVTEHPWWSLLITLIFAIVIFAVYLIVRIWQRLEHPWLDDIAQLIDYRIRAMFSGYHKRYCKYLGYQHRDFDVKGPGFRDSYVLELDQTFIEISINPTMIEQMTTNPIPQKPREENLSIWDHLVSTHLDKRHLVIVGPPGSGKTTLLKHITLTLLAQTFLKHIALTLLALAKGSHDRIRVPRKLPILLFLRDHSSAIHASASKDKPDFTLVEALHDHLKRWEQPDPPAGWVKRQLDNGRCLVLLDGLDEVADPQARKEVVSWVETQMVRFHENRFIITSRPFGFRDNPLKGVAMLEARPFTPEQVERFIHKWYLANEIMSKQKDDEGVRMRARDDAKGLLQQLYSNPTLLALTVNPLLLTMIAIVHRYVGKLPEKRVSLYADICKVFLGERQKAKRQLLELKPDQLQLVLKPLAYHMMQSGIRDITPSEASAIIQEPLGLVNAQLSQEPLGPANAQLSVADFLKLVENVSGLLLERENGIYSFAHQTFQEYLTAIYIHEKQWGNSLTRYVKDSWWRETILLYCAMADATPIIEACLADNPPSISALVLAFDCQKDALPLPAGVKTRLDTILIQGMEDVDPQRQHIAAEVLLTRRSRPMVYIKENTFIDTSLITCAEYQLFLDEQRAQGKYHQPDHWQSYRFSPGQGRTPVLGIRSSDAAAFCEWLTARETDPWSYRLPTPGELQQTADENILNSDLAGAGYWSNKGFEWLKEPLLLPHNVIRDFIVQDSDLALDRNRVRDLDRANDLALDRNLGLIRDLACARVRIFDLVHVRDLPQVRNLALDLTLARDLNLTPARDLAQILDLARDLTLARDLALDHDRACVRALSLSLALAYISFQMRSSSRRAQDEMQGIIDAYLDIYITFLILEARIQDRLPAWEGILIVKERKQKNA